MAEIYNTINDVLPTLLYFVPALLGFCVFVHGIRFALRILGGDLVICRDEPEDNLEDVPKSEKSESFDIPEKQKDFIQLN